ncbi:MAG: CRTAC1 family protein [Verrucomicrobiales bacterium]|nr:CRTAC1 family protein [Verrucomicrobiales bacterium]
MSMPRKGTRALGAVAIGLISVQAAGPLPTFTDITESAGIRFQHSVGDAELSNIVEGTGPGGALFDYDGDGWLDLYFVSGCWHPDISDSRGRSLQGKLFNALYHNNHDGTFTDVSAKAGVANGGYGMSATAADYDNDGDLDLYVLNYGPNVLYRNNGDGTFTEVTREAGLEVPVWSIHAAWFDYDRDGDLDVYVVNYLTYDKGEFQRSGAYYKAENYPGPLAYPGAQDRLFRNDGNGHFTDVTTESGLTAPKGRGMSAVAVDVDGDGRTDVYVANDAMPNSLWIQDQPRHFVDRAVEMGAAFGEGGQGASSMGPVAGDVDRDGRIDFFIPDMSYGCLLLQQLPGMFLDVTAQSNLALICGQYTGWGGGLFDYDNDGWLDVFVANGNAHHLYSEEDVLARNDGNGRFEDVSRRSGDYFDLKFVGRGTAFGDLDNDGDVDVVVFNLNARPAVLRNDGGNRNHWLKVVPRLGPGRAVALGTRVTVRAGGAALSAPAVASNGYLVSNDPRPNFGLGTNPTAETVEVLWPDGRQQTLRNVKADQILEVIPGE